jgi:hypothetical protein
MLCPRPTPPNARPNVPNLPDLHTRHPPAQRVRSAAKTPPYGYQSCPSATGHGKETSVPPAHVGSVPLRSANRPHLTRRGAQASVGKFKYAEYAEYDGLRYEQYAEYISGELLALLAPRAPNTQKWYTWGIGN